MTKPDPIPRLADADWLRSTATQRVLAMIAAGGFEARAVGGVVRNALLGRPVTDIDIATTAMPEDVKRLAAADGLAVVETGIEHGTVTVIADHHPFEVTTLRRDVSTDGRRATVAFTEDWAEDARRRDFTMNALYCDAAGHVHDPLGGYADLVARRVRFVGDAGERIREDYLRVLRFFRFSAEYGEGPLDADGLSASTREREGLTRLSAERIRQELIKLLVARRGVEHVTAMQDHGVLTYVLPVAPRPALLARLAAIEQSAGQSADAALRLGALAVETPEDAAKLASKLKLSRDERDVLELSATRAARMEKAPDEQLARRALYRHGPADYSRVIALSWARSLGQPVDDPLWLAALALPGRWPVPKLPVSGGDVIARGVAAGPRVGDMLRRIETAWIASDFTLDRNELLDLIDQLRSA